jgi:hypothetical protein
MHNSILQGESPVVKYGQTFPLFIGQHTDLVASLWQ